MIGSLSTSARRHASWTTGVLLAAGLLLALGVWIAHGPSALAAGGSTVTVICADGESSSPQGLQWALDQAVPGTPLTINIDQANCQMLATTSLVVGSGVDITINGNGLTLDGGRSQAGYYLFNIEDSVAEPTTLSLNHVTLENAFSGVYETPTGSSDYAATVNLTGGTVNNTYYGLDVAVTTVKQSTFTNNDTADYPYAATIEHSTFIDNSYAVYVVENRDDSLPGDVTVKDSTFTNSTYISGSYAIYAINDATVTGSTVSTFDYGIYVYNDAKVKDSTVSNTAFDSGSYAVYAINDATVAGSSVSNYGYGVEATTATVTNSTLTGNAYAVDAITATVTGSTISGSTSIGIYVYFATVSRSTFTDNVEGIQVYAGNSYIGDATVAQSTFTGSDCAVHAWIDPTDSTYSATAEVSNSRFDQNGYGIYGGGNCPHVSSTGVQAASVNQLAPGSQPAPNPKLSGKGTTHPASVASQVVKPATVTSTPMTMSLTDSEITNSSADGIFTSETADVTGSTIANNGGDGIAADGINAGFATVVNSTISDNAGAGVSAGTATIVYGTIADNQVAGVSATSATLTATLLASNVPNCAIGFLTDEGANLSTDNSCAFDTGNFTSHSGVARSALALGPLADNGGPQAGASGSKRVIQTMALGAGSLAVNRTAVNESGQCITSDGQVVSDPSTGNPITTDERGVTRPQGSRCDSGAFEANLLATTASGTSTVVHQGFYALIRVEALDANGKNISSRTLPVTAVELDGSSGQVIPFSYQFQFGRFGRENGYQLSINTRNLAPGQWTLVVKIGDTYPATLYVPFTVE